MRRMRNRIRESGSLRRYVSHPRLPLEIGWNRFGGSGRLKSPLGKISQGLAECPQRQRALSEPRRKSPLNTATRVRRGWDSNPRATYAAAGFQDRCLQPLGHPSEPYKSSTYMIPTFGVTVRVPTYCPLFPGFCRSAHITNVAS